jgi:hypothetical protein
LTDNQAQTHGPDKTNDLPGAIWPWRLRTFKALAMQHRNEYHRGANVGDDGGNAILHQ